MIPTALTSLALIILVVAFALRPFFLSREGGTSRSGATLRRRADLLAARNRIYAAIKTLDADYANDQIPEAAYKQERYELVAEGVDVLKALDELPPVEVATPIEEAIQQMRQQKDNDDDSRKRPPPPPGKSKKQLMVCHNCGAPIDEDDQFCATCGARLKRVT